MIRVGLLPEKLTSEQTFLLDEYTWAPYSLHLFTVTYSYWGNTPLLHFSPNLGEKQQYKTLKKKKSVDVSISFLQISWPPKHSECLF